MNKKKYNNDFNFTNPILYIEKFATKANHFKLKKYIT